MPRDWTPQQRALMRWLCLPGDDLLGEGRGLREHKTLTALAQHLGVRRETLWAWQNMPGWDEALAVMAGRTFRSLKPDFIRTMSAVLLKPGAAGYDRVATAWVRYVEPSMNDAEEQARWNEILPELETTNKGDTERIASEELRALPPAEREIILDFMNRVRNREGTEVVQEIQSFQVKRMLTEAEENLGEKGENGEIVAVNHDTANVNVNIQGNGVRLLPDSLRPPLPPIVRTSTNKWKPKRKK